MELVRIEGLPEDPLAAAAAFHADHVERLRSATADLLLAFPAADHTHRAWRLAAVQMLARAIVPRRINAVSGGDEGAVTAAAGYIAAAPGVTGQVIALDQRGAGCAFPA